MEKILERYLGHIETALEKQMETLDKLERIISQQVDVFERHIRVTESVDKRLLMVMSGIMFLGLVQFGTLFWTIFFN